MSIPIRATWAVRVLNPAPESRILEIGCGRGVVVSLLADRLTTGQVVGIDRSATMIEAARVANRDPLATGKLSLHAAGLVEAPLPDHSFDQIFAVNVSLFWIAPFAGFARVERLLAPGGQLYIFHQGPSPHKNETVLHDTRKALAMHGYQIVEERSAAAHPADVTCVIAEPA